MGENSSKNQWLEMHEKLMENFRIRTLPVAYKYYEKEEDMRAVEGLTIQEQQCTPCLAVGQAVYLEMCIGLTTKNFNTNYCRAVNGFAERDEKWKSAVPYLNRWSENLPCAQAHHAAMNSWGDRRNEGFAVAPLKKGIIDDPDGILMYVTPEQCFWILTSSVNVEYKKRNFTFLGESTCNDSWLQTSIYKVAGLAIGSNGERVFGGLCHDEMILTLPVEDVKKALVGVENIRKGREFLIYPMPPYSAFADIGQTPNPAFEGY